MTAKPKYASPRYSDKEQLVGLIENNVLYDRSSIDIQEIVDDLPEDSEEALSYFCDRFELGNWFYEALLMNEIDISDELITIGLNRGKEEKEHNDEQAQIQSDLQRANGWPESFRPAND